MSGFFGIFNRNGNPVEKKIAEDMLESMSEWEPDERDLWINGSVALGHAMLWNTPESKYEHLPVHKGTYILAMDARIDNREELAIEVELPDRPMSEIGDSEFILAAYEKWGEECPKYLLGDFAFVIWDEKKEQLFCVRDHIGIKPLFYFQSDELFVFSNDISVMLMHLEIPKDFDDLTIAYFVKDAEVFTRNTTFFEKIKILPPSTSMIVSEKEIEKKTYWRIEDSPPIRCKNFQEYAKKLRELFDDAVKVRLRSDYTMATHLSGGIDSSPIAVLAARELAKQSKPLHAFNWIDIPEDTEKYEFEAWNFSRRIAAGEDNIIHEEFTVDPIFIAKQYETHNIFTQGAMYFWDEYYVQDKMKEINSRVILSGWGGDELISNSGYSYISGLFVQGNILMGLYYFLQNRKYSFASWIMLFKSSVKSILPPVIFRMLKKIVKPGNDVVKEYEVNYYSYLTDTFKKFVDLQRSIEYPLEKGVRKRQLILYNFGHIQERIESWTLSSFASKMEYRYPLLDKRIVEFAVGIPEELFYPQKGKERVLFKTAILDLLPYDIVWFNKPNETKVNKAREERYMESLRVLQKQFKHKKLDYTMDYYFNYDKMYNKVFNFNFKSLDIYELDNILCPFLFLNAKLKLEKNYKIKESIDEKELEKTNS